MCGKELGMKVRDFCVFDVNVYRGKGAEEREGTDFLKSSFQFSYACR